MNKDKIVCDAIFGFITLKPYITAIIDTPEFQRLRGIWQLGLTPFVYPSAHHNRFEHSIGTYWLASKIITKIQKQLDDENAEITISTKDVICVEIAALCHDIGHGPFSHFWDEKVLKRFGDGNSISHEKQFKEMWKILKKNKKVREMIERYDIDENDEQLIDDLVNGTKNGRCNILFSIVNNSESGMDVDKWDYLARDSVYLGHSTTNYRTDIERMLLLVRAIKFENGEWKLAFRDTEGLNIIRVFQLRHYMHQTAYKHRTSIAMEQMMLDGIERCINERILSIDEIGTAKWILKNTDAIFWSNFYRIEEFNRILTRDFYKPICEAVKYEIADDPQKELKACLSSHNIDLNNVRFGFYNFKLGNKNTNPIITIPFYKKKNDREIFYYKEETLPSNLNINCNETRIIIFLKSLTDVPNVENIKKYLRECLISIQWEVL